MLHDSERSVPQRLPSRLSRVHRFHNSKNLKESSLIDINKQTQKIRDLEMKIEVLKEVLKYRKRKVDFDSDSQDMEIGEMNEYSNKRHKINQTISPSVKHVNHSYPNSSQSSSIIPIPSIFTFNENVDFPLKSELRPYSRLLIEIMNHIYAPSFNVRVDWEKLGIPDYPLKIKRPMDLGTIKTRLENGEYNLPKDFIDDVRQVWTNAQNFNPPGNQYNTMARILSDLFEKRIKEINSQNTSISKTQKDIHPLTEADIDQATGKVIELSIFEKRELGRKIMGISQPKHLETIINIINSDSSRSLNKTQTEKKLEFDITSLDDVTCKKLKNLIDSIPNLRKVPLNSQKRKLDPNVQIKQLKTQISNEFGGGSSSLLKMSSQNLNSNQIMSNISSQNTQSKMSSSLYSSSNNSLDFMSKQNKMSSNIIHSDDNSSSSSESDDDETECSDFDQTNEKLTLTDPASVDTATKSKVSWQWSAKKPIKTTLSSLLPSGGKGKMSNINQTNTNLKMSNYRPQITPSSNSFSFNNPTISSTQNNILSRGLLNENIGQKSQFSSGQSSVPPPPPQSINRSILTPFQQRSKEIAKMERERQNSVNLNYQQNTLNEQQKRFS